MSKVLSLKLKDDVFLEIENIIRKILQKQLVRESMLVQNNSLEVLAEFEKLEEYLQRPIGRRI